MKICIIIPVYNEAAAIGGVVRAIKEKGLDVIVVDDGSNDGCGDIARAEGAKVITQAIRHGKGYSLKIGFKHAIDSGYAAILMMDGDGQHRANDVDAFLAKAQRSPVSIITGSRMHDMKNMPHSRRIANRVMSKIISFFSGVNIPDTQCGMRYIHSGILKDINVTTNGYEIETEILMKAAKKKYPIYSVNIQTIYEGEKSKIRPLTDTGRFIKYFLREIFTP